MDFDPAVTLEDPVFAAFGSVDFADLIVQAFHTNIDVGLGIGDADGRLLVGGRLCPLVDQIRSSRRKEALASVVGGLAR
ncbi:MAG: hypothetical protein HY735_25200 [Verrucomicrobia bacterium]|nr:hypothetical protein [Verrucomicrobiota bacterium]